MKFIKNNKEIIIALFVVLSLPLLWWLFKYRYTSSEALNEAILKKTKKALISEGYIDSDDVLFYADSFYMSGPSGDFSHTVVFFTFDGDGHTEIFISDSEGNAKGGRIGLKRFSAKSLNDYSLDALNKGGISSFSGINFALGDALNAELSELKSYPGGNTKPVLDKAAAASAVTDTSTVYDYIYQTAADKEIFKEPLKLATFFFPHLNNAETEKIKYDETEELVHFIADGEGYDISFKCYRKLAGGKCLYCPTIAGGKDYEEAVRKRELLCNVTKEQLDGSDYYVICNTKDGSATLYGVYEQFSTDYGTKEDVGVVLRTQDEILPIYIPRYLSRPETLLSGDFDYDDCEEYAFIVKSGDGADTLFIADPDEGGAVSMFSERDDLVTGKMVNQGIHNYVYNSEARSLNSRIDPLDLRGTRETTLSLDEMYVTDYPASEVSFNDENFRITYDGYSFGFALDGDTAGYDDTLMLRAGLIYKKGHIWHDNLHIERQAASAASDGEFLYKTYGELKAGVLSEAQKALAEAGTTGDGEVLFYVADDDEYSARSVDDKNVYETEEYLVSFDEKGIKNIFIIECVIETNGNAARINSLNVLTPEGYIKKAGNNESGEVIPYGFSELLRTSFVRLRTGSADAYEKLVSEVTACCDLAEKSCVIEYEYEKASDKTVYADPAGVMKRFFPSFSIDGFERIKLFEGTELLKGGEFEETRVIEFNKVRGRSDDVVIFIPESGHLWEYESAVKAHELLDNVTAAELDNAHEDYPEWEGFFDDKDSSFFVAGKTSDGSAVLYGIYNVNEWSMANGAILRTKDAITPVFTNIDYGWNVDVFAGDFDGDGKEEYAFTRNDGHGTGFYREALYIVDPDKADPVTWLDGDDVFFGREDICGKVKYEYDDASGVLTFWLEENGVRADEGKMEIPKDFWSMWDSDATFGELIYGDLFYITFEDGVLGFMAKGGVTAGDYNVPDYTYSVDFCGDIVYKDGHVSFDNFRLEPSVAQ